MLLAEGHYLFGHWPHLAWRRGAIRAFSTSVMWVVEVFPEESALHQMLGLWQIGLLAKTAFPAQTDGLFAKHIDKQSIRQEGRSELVKIKSLHVCIENVMRGLGESFCCGLFDSFCREIWEHWSNFLSSSALNPSPSGLSWIQPDQSIMHGTNLPIESSTSA